MVERSVSEVLRLLQASSCFRGEVCASLPCACAETLAAPILSSRHAQNPQEQCVLQNQIEIMGALSLLLRYAQPDLVGKAGELDRQRDDLLQRHKATQRALADTSTDRGGK